MKRFARKTRYSQTEEALLDEPPWRAGPIHIPDVLADPEYRAGRQVIGDSRIQN